MIGLRGLGLANPNRYFAARSRPKLRAAVAIVRLMVGISVVGCAADVSGSGSVRAEPTWEEFRASATRVGAGFLVDGDLFFETEEHLRLYFDELVLNTIDKGHVITRISTGKDQIFAPSDALDINYCVDEDFDMAMHGGNRARVVSDMAEAARGWERVANVRFKFNPVVGDACTYNSTGTQYDFAVYPSTADLRGCATPPPEAWGTGAPHPFSCPLESQFGFGVKRALVLNYPVIDAEGTASSVGVIKHELGHTLGFHHEHIFGPAGCDALGELDDYAAFDVGYRALTQYDPLSVMHYNDPEFCGTLPDLELSPLDGVSARKLYGMPAAWYVPTVLSYGLL